MKKFLLATLLIALFVFGNWWYATHNLPIGEGARTDQKSRAQELLESFTDEEKVGQLLMPAYEVGVSSTTLQWWLCEYHIGGYMILRKDITPDMTRSIQEIYEKCTPHTEVPLFVAFDAEPSLMQYRLPSAGVFPETRDIADAAEAERVAAGIADALDPFGVNINLAPMYDSPDNMIITQKRSFGGSPEHIVNLANAFANTTRTAGILPTAKHFPGHGGAVGDTHEGIQEISGSLPELAQFISAIQSDIPLMMVAHLAVSGGVWDTEGLPATLSREIMTELLRTELGYEGIVITDAFNMKAVSGVSDAASRAIEAGADIVLMPLDIGIAVKSILARMQYDVQFKERVSESVLRVLTTKMENIDTE